MASWKKIIVSGSNAHLNEITSSVLTDTNLVIAGNGGALQNSNLTLTGGNLNISSNSIISTGTNSVLSGSFTGSFTGDGSGLTGLPTTLNISGSDGSGIPIDLLTQDLTIGGTANEIETSAAGTILTIGLPDDVVIGQDLTVSRNLTVLGTASFQHSTNLDVADRFIRLASGSNANGDGGIAIQQTSNLNAETFGFDSGEIRWGVTSSFDASQNSFTPDAYMALSLIGTGTDPAAVAARYSAKGNIFVGTDENVWVYS
jgi:hypothetical protein